VKKVAEGEFGVFLAEVAKQNEFIMELCGVFMHDSEMEETTRNVIHSRKYPRIFCNLSRFANQVFLVFIHESETERESGKSNKNILHSKYFHQRGTSFFHEVIELNHEDFNRN
jgi:hypothetical protein